MQSNQGEERTMKKNKKFIKQIADSINEKINSHYTEEQDVRTYNVTITTGKTCIDVTPNNGGTFYCIDELVKIANFFEVSHYITIVDNEVVFRMYGI